MYDPSMRLCFEDINLAQFIDKLQMMYPSGMQVACCGSSWFYCHANPEDRFISFDTEDVNDGYFEESNNTEVPVNQTNDEKVLTLDRDDIICEVKLDSVRSVAVYQIDAPGSNREKFMPTMMQVVTALKMAPANCNVAKIEIGSPNPNNITVYYEQEG